MDYDWWQNNDIRGHLEQALTHINGVNAIRNLDQVAYCRGLFDALNCLWTAHRRVTNNFEASDSAAIRDLILSIPGARKQWLCKSSAILYLTKLTPPILDHDVLRRSSSYRPSHPIPPDLTRKAADKHSQLAHAMDRWKNEPTDATETALLKKLAQMLYVIRSNIAHGEKTPFGPDLKKAARDRQVCTVTIPVLDDLFQSLLDYPANRLVVYGSFAPGQPNHAVLANIPGHWEDGFVYGILQEADALPVLQWKAAGERISIKIFVSTALKENLDRLDQFEGTCYHRILVPIEKAHGGLAVGNLYEQGAHLFMSKPLEVEIVNIEPGSEAISEEELRNVRGDPEILRMIDRLFHEELSSTPFSSKFDTLLEQLSFSNEPITEERRRTAWSQFLNQSLGPSYAWGWPLNIGVAMWYEDRGMSSHALSVYEALHSQVRQEHLAEEAEKNYLLNLMSLCLDISDFERARSFLTLIEEAYEDGYLTSIDYAEAFIEFTEALPDSPSRPGEEVKSQNRILRTLVNQAQKLELENRTLNQKLMDRIAFDELVQKAQNKLQRCHTDLIAMLEEDTRRWLCLADVFSQSPFKERGPEMVPIYYQKAIEKEFNTKVWPKVREIMTLPKRYDSDDLSINKIYAIMTPEVGSREQIEKAFLLSIYRRILKILGRNEMDFKTHQTNLNILKKHSTDARHGQAKHRYRSERLESFLTEVKPENWAFQFLALLQPKAS